MSLPFARAGEGSDARVVHALHSVGIDDFETLARPFVERSLDLTAKALSDAGVEASAIDLLVLSGGTSRMPLVRRMIAERFGLRHSGGVNPSEIVALGAAVAASMEEGPARLKVRDVVSRTYGVEVDGGLFVPLIKKNSPVPASKSRIFTTVQDGQDSVEIHVLQGESKRCEEALSLGKFLLAGIKPAKAGKPQIRVDFGIDESDILHVAAIDLETGRAQTISIADLGRGAADESPSELVGKANLLAARIDELKTGMDLEAGLEAELEEAARRAASAGPAMSEGELRLLKAELEGLVGELLARRSEATPA
jgi:molecular chaperone DnaK